MSGKATGGGSFAGVHGGWCDTTETAVFVGLAH